MPDKKIARARPIAQPIDQCLGLGPAQGTVGARYTDSRHRILPIGPLHRPVGSVQGRAGCERHQADTHDDGEKEMPGAALIGKRL